MGRDVTRVAAAAWSKSPAIQAEPTACGSHPRYGPFIRTLVESGHRPSGASGSSAGCRFRACCAARRDQKTAATCALFAEELKARRRMLRALDNHVLQEIAQKRFHRALVS